MAKQTPISQRSLILYSIYLRAHTPQGSFRAAMEDLDRIAALGVDVIWLMPIHPIGVKGKKGSLGCPYANADYRSTNPEYGSLEDLRALVEAIHQRGMKCIIDVVYNHTSPDSTLLREHPEFFYRRPDGSFGNRVGDWTDVVDLDYGCRALWDYQIESLCYWAQIVDGFRCDVASLVPLDFWLEARAAVARLRPDCLWLAESVHRSFAMYNRRHGLPTADDYALFSAFDMEYDYDIREVFDAYVRGEGVKLSHYIDLLNLQEALYPENYNKMRCLENHDNPRIASLLPERDLPSWTAMLYFLKGATLLYAGQEFSCSHLPSLFEREVFSREGRDLSPLLQQLAKLKKERLRDDDAFEGSCDDRLDVAILRRWGGGELKLGLFSLKGKTGPVATGLADGSYPDLLSGRPVQVSGGLLEVGPESPRILLVREP